MVAWAVVAMVIKVGVPVLCGRAGPGLFIRRPLAPWLQIEEEVQPALRPNLARAGPSAATFFPSFASLALFL